VITNLNDVDVQPKMKLTDSLILAGASVRSLAESAMACGLRPYCVDMFHDADLQTTLRENGHPPPIQIARFSEIPAAIEHLTSDIPLVWLGGVENHPETLHLLQHQRPVFGAATECLSRIRSEVVLRSLVVGSECGVPDVLTQMSHRSCRADSNDWLIKPNSTCGGLGIRHYKTGCRLGPDEFLQRYVPGNSLSVLYHRHDRTTQMIGACIQITGEPALGGADFKFCGCIGPVKLNDRLCSILNSVGCRIAATDITGIFGADFIIGENGIWLIEVNPRITASHELYDFAQEGPSVLQRQLASWNHEAPFVPAPSNPVESPRVLARLIVYLKQDGVLEDSDSRRLLDFRRTPGTRRNPPWWLADIPPTGVLTAGQPFCSVYYVLNKRAYGWSTDADESEVNELNDLLSRFTGVSEIETSRTAIQYASLFEPAADKDNSS